uniref:Uncharacterized protein n=1 Tax=Nelumbo nucifera TaxID=4432 RepID=A0A822YB75_NELNU|nr:TPA_asm: hypothetical protein HUJ06_029743 [Nelumbo nucifera]
MVVAAAISNSEANLGVTVTAAATATAAVNNCCYYCSCSSNNSCLTAAVRNCSSQKDGVADRTVNEPQGIWALCFSILPSPFLSSIKQKTHYPPRIQKGFCEKMVLTSH